MDYRELRFKITIFPLPYTGGQDWVGTDDTILPARAVVATQVYTVLDRLLFAIAVATVYHTASVRGVAPISSAAAVRMWPADRSWREAGC